MGKTYRAYQSRLSPYQGERKHEAVKRKMYGKPKDKFRFDPRKSYQDGQS